MRFAFAGGQATEALLQYLHGNYGCAARTGFFFFDFLK
jgi:hypothetical protein